MLLICLPVLTASCCPMLLLQPELKRSEKSLVGMAAGVWLVKQTWLADSDAAGRLLDPEPYELEGRQTATGSISEGAGAASGCVLTDGLHFVGFGKAVWQQACESRLIWLCVCSCCLWQ